MALTGAQAIGAVVGIAFVHEVTCDEGELISNLWDEWMMRRPVITTILTIAFVNITAAHLCNAMDRPHLARFDPYSGFGYPLLTAIKSAIKRV